jgi:hypothetical protein
MSSDKSSKSLMKHTSAWLPILMSFVALMLVVGYIAFFGGQQVPMEDEETAARIFQILMGSQVFVLTYFSARWLPLNPQQGLKIIALQVLAAIMVIACVYLLEM